MRIVGTDQQNTKVCDKCRIKKVFCDKVLPKCGRCIEHNLQCSWDYQLKKPGIKKGRILKRDFRMDNSYVCFTPTHFKSGVETVRWDDSKFFEYKSKLNNSSSNNISNTDSENEKEIRNVITGTNKQMKVEKLNRVSINYLDLKFSLAQLLFTNSLMDTKQKVLISTSTGKMDYFGESPMGLLLTMYIIHHSQPKNLPKLMHKSNKAILSNLNLPLTSVLNVYDTGFNRQFDLIFDKILNAYFNYFNPYFPVVNRCAILKLKYNYPNPFLINLVAAIGCNYLPELGNSINQHFAQRAQHHLELCYLIPSLDTTAGLLIAATFQHSSKYCNKGFLNLGLAIRNSYALGLDIKPPTNLDPTTVELRNRVWMWCHIVDKLYGFGMNRPFAHDYRQTFIPKLKLSNLDWKPNSTQLDNFTTVCSLHYTTLFAQLSQFMYLMVRKFNFIQPNPNLSVPTANGFKIVNVTATHIHQWEHKVNHTFSTLTDGLPLRFRQVAYPFLINLKMISQSLLLQMYQTYIKVKLNTANDINLSEYALNFELLATNTANSIVDMASSLNYDFNFCGMTYRFTALSLATFFIIRNLSTAPPNSNKYLEAESRLKTALQIFELAEPYYDIAKESIRMANILVKAENINIDGLG